MVVYPFLDFYEWIFISIFILCPLLNILYFVHEQIFFSLHLPYYIQWFFSVVRQPVKALSSSMLVQVFHAQHSTTH